MRAAVADLQQGMLDPVGLKQLEEQFITEYFLDNETNAAQADFLARSQLYEGDYREADRFVDELKSVTPEACAACGKEVHEGISVRLRRRPIEAQSPDDQPVLILVSRRIRLGGYSANSSATTRGSIAPL